MQDSYEFPQSLTTYQVYALLKKAAIATKSRLDYAPNIVHIFDSKTDAERSWAQKPSGAFVSSSIQSTISFSLEAELDEEESSKIVQFKKIQFSQFELQDFNQDGNLGKYVSELISEIEKACKERAITQI